MQAISTILVLLLFIITGFYIHALIKPKHKIYAKHFGESATRGTLSRKFLPALVAIFILIGVTAPPSQADQQPSGQPTAQTTSQPPAPRPVTKEVTEKTPVPFTTQTVDDSSLPQGQTSIAQEGVNGEKTTVYEVTYLDNKETGRTVKSDDVTTQPIPKIVHNGTYVAPAPTTQSGGDGYTNVDGNHIDSPSSNPSGATAQCNDGTYSYSQHHSGTCSHHGGVAAWL